MPTLATAVGIGSAAVAMDVIVVDYTSLFHHQMVATQRERERERERKDNINIR